MDEPWKTEPDSGEWQHLGLRCRIRRNPESKTLNGYVGLPATHPLFEVEKDEIDLDVHGGITYAEPEGDGLWWIGFDCAHAGDLMPGLIEFGVLLRLPGVYRNWEWVTAETESLALQCKQLALEAAFY